jgi:predicted PP-loop superfamily ATPase
VPLVVAFSGGKDSTALALRLHELEEPFKLLFTPTGDELPELHAHSYGQVCGGDDPDQDCECAL